MKELKELTLEESLNLLKIESNNLVENNTKLIELNNLHKDLKIILNEYKNINTEYYTIKLNDTLKEIIELTQENNYIINHIVRINKHINTMI